MEEQNAAFIMSHAHFLLLYFGVCQCMEATPLFHMRFMRKIRSFTGLHRAMPVDRFLLQASGVLPCSMSVSHGIAAVQSTCIIPVKSHSHLLEACPGAYKLAGFTSALCTTPTDPSLYLLVITGICTVTYLQYANSTNSNVCLGFSYPGHQDQQL